MKSFPKENTEPVLLYVEQDEGGFCPFLLQMPDDILLLLTRFLSIEDLFRWFRNQDNLNIFVKILQIKQFIDWSSITIIAINESEQDGTSLQKPT